MVVQTNHQLYLYTTVTNHLAKKVGMLGFYFKTGWLYSSLIFLSQLNKDSQGSFQRMCVCFIYFVMYQCMKDLYISNRSNKTQLYFVSNRIVCFIVGRAGANPRQSMKTTDSLHIVPSESIRLSNLLFSKYHYICTYVEICFPRFFLHPTLNNDDNNI